MYKRNTKYANGGKIDPPIKGVGLSPEQQKEAEQDVLFVNNWNANRVVNNKKLPKGYQISPNQPVILSNLNENKKEGEGIDRGSYNRKTGEIFLDPSFQEEYGIPAHEYSHRFQDKTKLLRPKVYQDYIKGPIEELVPNIETYQSDPNEIHSELMRLRRNANFRPDQVIVPEDVENVDFNNYNFNDIKDKDTLIQLLNSTAYNNPKTQTVAAYGGKLNMNMKTIYAQGGQLTRFDEGASHEENPLGGIPQGQSADGSVNSVEQGETKNNDYIYSNRISLDEDLVKQFNLPGYTANKSVADASKAIDNKFKDRFDKYSTETKNTLLNRLTEAQEFIKQQEQAQQEQINQSMQSNSQQIPDMMNGEIPAGMEDYVQTDVPTSIDEVSQPIAKYGGYQLKYFNGGALKDPKPSVVTNEGQLEASKNTNMNPGLTSNSSLNSAIGMGVGALGNIGQGLFQENSRNLNYTPQEQSIQNGWEKGKDAVASAIPIAGLFRGAEKLGKGLGQSIGGDKGGDFASGFLDPMQNVFSKDTNVGEKVLSVLDPFVSGMIMRNKNDKRRAENLGKSAMAYNRQFDNLYAKGGKLERPDPELPYANLTNNYDINSDVILPDNQVVTPTQTKAGFEKYYRDNTQSNLGKLLSNVGSKVSKYGNQALNYANENYGEALRYAPIAMNAYQLSKLKKPTGVVYNTLDNRYKPTYVDEARLQNIVDQDTNNQINAISESGASQGALRSSILGAGLNRTKALSNAYTNAVTQNASENQTAQQFNLGVDSTNVGIRNKAIDEMRMDDAAYRGAKSKLLSTIGTDLGSVGKEIADAKLAESLTGYTRRGKYIYKPDGSIASPEEIQAIVLKQPITKQSAFGGYLNLKKK